MRIRYFLLPLLVSQMGATDCGGNFIGDNGFDLWCGEDLCEWKIERGEIERVPTWHDDDSGVALLGPDTALEQFTTLNQFDGSCITFEMVADVDENAEMYLNIDMQGDGTLERSERIPTSSWKPVSYSYFLAAPFDNVRFELAKRGGGVATLAQIKGYVERDNPSKCSGLTPLMSGVTSVTHESSCTTVGAGGSCR